MKRFLLFVFDFCYPRGGWSDLRGSYDSIEAARASTGKMADYETYQVVDATSGRVVADHRPPF